MGDEWGGLASSIDLVIKAQRCAIRLDLGEIPVLVQTDAAV